MPGDEAASRGPGPSKDWPTMRNVETTLQYEDARETLSEKNRSYHQAVQARRGQGGAAGGRTARYHRHRSQGLRAAEGSRRTLSRGGVHRGLSAQGQNRDRDLG